MELKKYTWAKAIGATGRFEGPNGYANCVGNFDGQFLSLGLIQWNLGRKTLQPLLQKLFDQYPNIASSILPNSGLDLKAALATSTTEKWALSIQSNNKVIEPWLSAFKKLCATPEFISIQDSAMSWYKSNAIIGCTKHNLLTDRAFSLFFDIAVQNGGIPVQSFTTNATYKERLTKIAEAAVAKSNIKWQSVVRDRKMCIVNGTGLVYGGIVNLPYYDAVGFIDETLREPLDTLVSKEVIESPEYWLDNADMNIPCKGEYMATMILKATHTTTMQNALYILANKNLITDTIYWAEHSVLGRFVDGQNAKILIKRLATL